MFDELKYRFKSMVPWKRMVLVIFLGFIPGAYTYFEDIDGVEEQLAQATDKELKARQVLSDAKTKIKNLPEVESKLAFTREQLKKAETRLPGEVNVDEVIGQLGKAGKSHDVQVKSIIPEGFKTITGEFPYDEVKYKVTMTGRFPNLAAWLDDVASPLTRSYPKSWTIIMATQSTEKKDNPAETLQMKQANKLANAGVESGDSAKKDEKLRLQAIEQSPRAKAERSRETFLLDLAVDLVYYRVASPIPVDKDKAKDPAKDGQAPKDGDKKPPVETKTTGLSEGGLDVASK
jgi:Tfp pilus assembly protein PilO